MHRITRIIGRRLFWILSVVGMAVVLGAAAMAPADPPPSPSPAPPDPHIGSFYEHAPATSKSHLVQDAHWLALKRAHQVARPGLTAADVLPSSVPSAGNAGTPTIVLLNIGVAQNVLEALGANCNPNGTCTDDAGHSYVDGYFWNFCGPGSANVALYYWTGSTSSYPAGTYTEPSYAPYHSTTYWTSGDHSRSYEMYLAMQVLPPSFATPGLPTFYAYPQAGTTLPDLRDTLNWEASGHNSSTWSTYFYALQPDDSTLTPSVLHADVTWDIATSHAPIVPDVNAPDLPNWSTWKANHPGHKLIHNVTIIGYDDLSGNYYYTDTCGKQCGSNNDAGINTVSQATMYQAIMDAGAQGGYAW